MDYAQLEKTRSQRILNKIDIGTGIVTFLLFIGATLYSCFVSIQFGYLNSMNKNWDKQIFVAPNGYGPYEIFSFPKIHEGCYCNSTVNENICTESQLNDGCKNVSESETLIGYSYGDSPIRFNNGPSYKDALDRLNETGECSDKFPVQCGILDTLNQKYCVEKGGECPMKYIEEVTQGCNSSLHNKQQYYFEDNLCWNFSYTKEPEEDIKTTKVIAQITYDLDKPCLDPTEKQFDFYKYPLIDGHTSKLSCSFKTQYNNISTTTDPNYNHFGNFSNKSVYYLLSKFGQIEKYDKLVDSGLDNKTLNVSVQMYYRSFIGYNKKCVNQYNYAFIPEDTEDNIKNSLFAIKVYLFVLVADFLSMFILVFIPFSSKCLMLIRTAKALINFFTAFITIIAVNLCHFQTINYGCGDDLTNQIIKDLQAKLNNLSFVSLVLLIYAIIAFGLNILECYLQKEDLSERQSTKEVKLELYS